MSRVHVFVERKKMGTKKKLCARAKRFGIVQQLALATVSSARAAVLETGLDLESLKLGGLFTGSGLGLGPGGLTRSRLQQQSSPTPPAGNEVSGGRKGGREEVGKGGSEVSVRAAAAAAAHSS